MAFQLGTFIVNLLGDTSHLDAAMSRVKGGVQGVVNAVKGAASSGLNIPGADATKTALDGAKGAALNLGDALGKLLNIDLSTIFKLASVAGAVSLIGAATRKFMELSDESKNMEFRFRVLGMETEENTKRVFAFGKQMQESFGVGQAEARKMSMDALTKSINPGRYQEMTASAVSLGAALGISNQRALGVVEQLEAGNTTILRRLHPSFRILMEQGASRFTLEQKVNEMIAQGGTIAKERMKTFQGQVDRLKNAFSNLGDAVAGAIGPAIAPVVAKLADALEGLTKKVTKYIEANKETIGQTIRTGAAVVGAAGAFFLLHGYIGSAIGMIGGFLPSVGELWKAFEAGKDIAPFQAILDAVKSFKDVIKNLVKFTLKSGLTIALNLFSPTAWWAAITQGVLIAYGAVVGVMGLICGVASVGVRLLGMAIKAVTVALGFGLIIGFLGLILGFADTFGEAATGATGFGAVVKQVMSEFKDIIGPILHWLKVEGQIVFKALIAFARQMLDNFKIIWGYVQQGIDKAIKFIKENFGQSIQWIESTFGVKIDSIQSMWAEFTAELAVLGLRIRQIFLYIVLGLSMIPTVVKWLGACFEAFANYVKNDWAMALVQCFNLLQSALTLLGMAIAAIGRGIINAISGKGVSFDFSAVEAGFQKIKQEARGLMKDMKMPALDVSAVAPELRGEINKVTKELNDKKQQARESQARDRLNAQNRGTGKTDGTTEPAKGVPIGGRDKAQFQETVGFWKKVQEAGANQRAEYLQQQQLDQQREMVRLLTSIREASMMRPVVPPGGVIPRAI